jgi:hypothetical protein
MDEQDLLAAAMEHWERIARFAWARHEECGRGVVLVQRDDLLADDNEGMALSYVPLEIIPRGDDFRGVISDYEPIRQVVLMVGDDNGDEQLLVLEPAGTGRPPPPEC